MGQFRKIGNLITRHIMSRGLRPAFGVGMVTLTALALPMAMAWAQDNTFDSLQKQYRTIA